MTGDRKKSVWLWIVAVLIGVPVLYVASSGPARSVLMRRQPATRPIWFQHKVNDRNGSFCTPLVNRFGNGKFSAHSERANSCQKLSGGG